MKLSINILTWNTINTLKETLALLKSEFSAIDHEVIVVDNGSTDGCAELATIKNPLNMGISVGKNQGIDASRGEYIMLIDGDIIPVPNSIMCLLKHMEQTPSCDAIGFHPNKFAQQRNKEGSAKYHEDYCHELVDLKTQRSHAVYYGMYRRTVFERGVRFDERYGVGYGYEDLDTYMQMEKIGIQQWFAHINHKAGKYYHEINSSIRQAGYEWYMETCKERGKIFQEKWGGVSLGVC